MKNELLDIINFSRTIPDSKWSVQDAVAKLFEEGGELSEAAQIKVGRLPHKTEHLDGDFEETADVMLCALDILCKLNPDMAGEDLIEKLRTMIVRKTLKWQYVQGKLP